MSQNREEALLAWALEKPPEKREAFLEGACFGDPDLRRRIESRLSAHEKESVTVANSATDNPRERVPLEGIDTMINQTITHKITINHDQINGSCK